MASSDVDLFTVKTQTLSFAHFIFPNWVNFPPGTLVAFLEESLKQLSRAIKSSLSFTWEDCADLCHGFTSPAAGFDTCAIL